jgi:hypothetical protein
MDYDLFFWFLTAERQLAIRHFVSCPGNNMIRQQQHKSVQFMQSMQIVGDPLHPPYPCARDIAATIETQEVL